MLYFVDNMFRPEAQQVCEACREEIFDEGNYNSVKRLRLKPGHDFQLRILADEIPTTKVPFKIGTIYSL